MADEASADPNITSWDKEGIQDAWPSGGPAWTGGGWDTHHGDGGVGGGGDAPYMPSSDGHHGPLPMPNPGPGQPKPHPRIPGHRPVGGDWVPPDTTPVPFPRPPREAEL